MKTTLLASTMLILAACGTQSPAPVTSGYSRMPWEPKLRKVETTAAVQNQVQLAQQKQIAMANQNTGTYRLTGGNRNSQTLAAPAQPAPRLQPVVAPTMVQPTIQTENLMAQSIQRAQAVQPAAGPVSVPQKTAAPAATKATPRMGTHVVQQGDTIYSLSRKYGVSVGQMLSANNKTDAAISTGEILFVPSLKPATVGQLAETQAPAQKYSLTRKTVTQSQPTTLARARQAVQSVTSIEPAAGPTALPKKANTQISYKTHHVKAGETLYRIGRAYGVTPFDLMAANNFDKPQDLMAGTSIKIPVANTGTSAQQIAETVKINQKLAQSKGMVWPAKGKILANYGQQGQGITHTGVNIALPENTPVAASESGTVIYADDGLKSYGNLVLIRHADGLVTAYAHNNQLAVVKDQKVKKGQTIAYSGKTGGVKTPQLHFEVRRNAQAINPLTILPKMNVASR